MNTFHNPSTVAKPASSYSQAVEVPANARWLYISGQIGVAPDGTPREGIEAQADQCWTNIRNILTAAGMGVGDIVKITTYLTNKGHLGTSRTARDKALEGARPASTLVVVAALASPAWLIEIEAVAAKPVKQ
jgi:enamine deaminase RidA (YjgF/YER057c/UK114 family)